MEKHISVPFYVASEHQTYVVGVNYTIERLAEHLVFSCTVDNDTWRKLEWLQLQSFELKARHHHGEYQKIFNDANVVKSIEGILFIDTVYDTIMVHEKELVSLAG